MSPEVWQAVARELNSIEQLARGPTAAKIARHVERVRRLVRPKREGQTSRRRDNPKPTHLRLLWKRDPRCFWCGRVTDITTANCDDSATDEHIYHRLHPKRQSTRRHLPDTVLACRRCNSERGAPSVAAPDVCPLLAAVKA